MDRFSHVTMILALVVLCALPLYCELKTEENFNFGVMEDIGDVPEAMRIKRGVQVVKDQDAPLSKLRKRKQTQKSIKQNVDDFKTMKRKNNVLKRRLRDGKRRTLNPVPGHKTEQKSDNKQILKHTANKKAIVLRGVRNSPQIPVPHEMIIEKDGVCVDDKEPISDNNLYHSLEKRGEPRTGKSGLKKKKSLKREIKLKTLTEIKSLSRKMDLGNVNDLEKVTSNKTIPGNFGKNTENGGDDDDKACVDENGALRQIRRSQNENEKPSKREGNVAAFNYYNSFPRVE